MSKIRILDEQLANQIAAGEVVERPSSVVKELVENAVDAGSTAIDIVIEEGGLTLVRVTDNGSGIEGDDIETAFYRHATSKISSSKDLFRIASLGFRGEALPSIAAVARVECVSSPEKTGLGRRLVIEGGSITANEEANAPQGTDISVRELFYNTPARLKYMKTIQTEIGHIADYVNRLALAHPGIAFTLKHNGGLLLRTLGGGDRLQAFAAIYGTATAKAMLPVSGEHPDYELQGYISKPEQTRSNRNGITIVVNGRYIKSFVINQAIMQAYHTLLPINRFPMVVLELGMHPSLLDVNVHPSKMEVRFSKEAELREFIEEAVKRALGKQRHIPGPAATTERSKPLFVQDRISFHQPDDAFPKAAPSAAPLTATSSGQSVSAAEIAAALDIAEEAIASSNSSDPTSAAPQQPQARQSYQTAALSDKVQPNNSSRTQESRSYTPDWQAGVNRTVIPKDATERLYAPPSTQGAIARESELDYAPNSVGSQAPEQSNASALSAAAAKAPESDSAPDSAASDFTSARAVASSYAAESQQPVRDPATPSFPELYWIGQLHGTYIIAQNEEGLFLIDQHAAHERINYEYFFEKFSRPEQASQQLLVPLTMEFTQAEAAALKGKLHYMQEAGVELEPFGSHTFLVRSYPEWLPEGDEHNVIEEMAEWLISERGSIDIGKMREKSAIMCSCKASIKANDRLTREEGEGLLRRLGACIQPYTCPHGRPIVVHMTTYQLEKMFKRVMS
ncbi:DNA mismatch repair endonuclease MutL [Paenibacillus sp. CF384]|uniref:DNA mismatch repair endonuclease MutL n=1 Tax=Paenibacillus sp. CF384 TaxID=1884382 RepID=UPI0008951FDE|nr:DNA mismatch repair endonuclease MutL [Paenibacillus sp. CF384]SDX77177.1 DNA mismatch repair protein MutL [Paenibacillus sp. CF384]